MSKLRLQGGKLCVVQGQLEQCCGDPPQDGELCWALLQPCFCDDLAQGIFVGERSLRAASNGTLAPVYSLVYNDVRSCWRVMGHVTTPDPTTLPFPYSFAAGGPVAYDSCLDTPCVDSQDPCTVGSCVLPNVPTRMRSPFTGQPDLFNGCARRIVSVWEATGTMVRIILGVREEFSYTITARGVLRPTSNIALLYEDFVFRQESSTSRTGSGATNWNYAEVFEVASWSEYRSRVSTGGGVGFIVPDPCFPVSQAASLDTRANIGFAPPSVRSEDPDLTFRLSSQVNGLGAQIPPPTQWGAYTFTGGSGTATPLPNGSRIDARLRINNSQQFVQADFAITHRLTMVPEGVDPDIYGTECPTTRKAVPCAGVTGPNIAVELAGVEWVPGQSVKVSIDGTDRCYLILNDLPDDSLEVYSPIGLFANCPDCLSGATYTLAALCDDPLITIPVDLSTNMLGLPKILYQGQLYEPTTATTTDTPVPVEWVDQRCGQATGDRFRLATRCPNGRRPGAYPETIRCPIETPVGTSLVILASGGNGLTCVIRYVATGQTTDDESLQIGTPTTRTACSGVDLCIDPDGGTGDQPSDLSDLCFICTGPAQPPVCSVPAVQTYLQSNCGRRLPGPLTQTSRPRGKDCLPCQQRREAGLQAALDAQRRASNCQGCGDAGLDGLI